MNFSVGSPLRTRTGRKLRFSPVNIYETADAFHLGVSAPRRSKEDFKLAVESGLLTVSFEKKEETKTEDYKTIRKEFSF